MRVASLVPSATETLFALGLDDEVVAVHELDERRLAALAPDLIVTQSVGAVDHEDIVVIAARLPSRPRVLQQAPSTLAEVFEDVVRLGEATGRAAEAHQLRAELEGRLAVVRAAVAGAPAPRVIALECLDPPFVGGHWMPEMISIAGGDDVAGPPGLDSPEVAWGALAGLRPEIVLVMPRGRDAERARLEARDHWPRLTELGAERVFAVDATATFSRPGPRLVDGVELLAHLIHPDLIDPPGNVEFSRLRAPAAAG